MAQRDPDRYAHLREAAREAARRTRVAQGLPPTVEDPATLGRIAALLASRRDDTQPRGRTVAA